MGDISMRGKGKALKMKKGGSTSRDKMRLPKIPGRIKKRTDGAMKRRAEEESMKELRYPTKKPTRRRPKRPKREPEARPMPMPMPRPDRPNIKPMPDRRPRLPKDLEKYFMKTPRRATPLMKKDGGEIKNLADLFSKPASKGFSKEALRKVFEEAKKFKPQGRLNMDDIKRAMDMITKGAGKGLGSSLLKKTEPKIKGRLGGPKTSPLKRRVSDALKRQSKIKDPKNKNKRLI